MKFAACRTIKHAWDPSSKVVGDVAVGLTALGLRCLRCTTERLDGIDAHGLVRSRRYAYPEGYLRKKGQVKLMAPDYRLRMLAASLESIRIKR